MAEFELDGHDYIELHKLLQLIGLAPSGGTAKMLIAEGLVKVDGVVELRKRCKIRSGQEVELEGETVQVV